ncbi:cell division protein FtsL [Rhizobium sp. BR 362]|uniref:cell division protein FtsL n=1 Tax=Rhizobium sp. BR 362 TaxID=3040670 RepID=UPI002F3FD48E
MLKTFDIVLIGVMTAMATVTYTIKHRAEVKLEEVHRLESEIKLEKDTIELLKADWALVVQPNRLERLVNNYSNELKLQPTLSTAIVQPSELPMLRSQLPPETVADAKDVSKDGGAKTASGKVKAAAASKNGDTTDAEIRKAIADVAAAPAPRPVAKAPSLLKRKKQEVDNIATGSVDE